jgi:hypothetical protein
MNRRDLIQRAVERKVKSKDRRNAFCLCGPCRFCGSAATPSPAKKAHPAPQKS